MPHEINQLHLDGVEFSRGQQVFRFDLFLDRPLTVIAGASGSGKTTLLNLVAGFEKPVAGRILLNGVDVTRLHPAERPVSLVFQDNNLFAHLDILTNIALGISPSLALTPRDRERILQAMKRTGLSGYEKRLPESLSGGERQRAAFARALVRNRPFLLLDEPFAALDPALRKSMGDLLRELQSETGIMVLMVSHLPDEVDRLADHVVFIDKGDILFSNSPDVAREEMPRVMRAFMGNE